MRVNSREYWNERFRTDWEALGGEAQSRFFAKVAIDAMPAWFRERLSSANLTLCDWGCAEGAGTEALAEALGVPVTGIDFSADAISVAKRRHRRASFLVADVTAAPIDARFDVVFSSNTLEHFPQPWKVFDTLVDMAGSYVVLLLPYRELVLHPEHFVTFTPSDFPAARNGLVLVHLAVVDAASIPGSSWPGDQVLCIYARPGELETVEVALSQLRFDTPAVEALEAVQREHARLLEELIRLQVEHARALEAARQQLGELREAHYQLGVRNRDLAASAETLSQVLRSRSWRWSRPLRVAIRLLSGRWGSEDRRKLRAMFAGGPPGGTLEVASDPVSLDHATKQKATDDAAQALTRQVPLAEAGGQADVFVWAVIDWHFRTQRPQHLARAMAERGHRVFYISNNFEDASTPGFRVEPLDTAGRLFQVHLHLAGRPTIYFGMPDKAQLVMLRESFACLLAWTRTRGSLSIVQHPFWKSLAMSCPDARVVYDCMDHHAGFENNAREILRNESDLIAAADLVVVTSDDLKQRIGDEARNLAIVRNGCDFGFFSTVPARTYRQSEGRQVIGYFGAIAEWFDPELVRAVARANPSAEVVLIGSDTMGCGALLADEANVRLVGEVPYGDLPSWLHGFDVCILPFRVVPLTLATNPVKVYEYLAAGKSVVAVDLPEMAQFGGLVRTARDTREFLDAVADALGESDRDLVTARQAFAASQTWQARAEELDHAIAAVAEPRVSVIVLTYNNLALTQACLFSLESYSNYPSLEIIVVDNASSDGSADWLRGWADQTSNAGHVRRLILNGTNAGFAGGNNIGLGAASGEVLVILNNDTYVTPGWVRTLCAHFRQQHDLGLISPVTNNIGNEARIAIAYDDMSVMHAAASAYTRAHPGQSFPLHTAAFFCVAMPRRVFVKVGALDEAFGIGFFEDDDYCRRVEQAGFRVACAEDVFVHHHLSASFDKMQFEEKRDLFERNKRMYESRWGTWTPHAYRRRHS